MIKYIVTMYNDEGLRLYLKDISVMEFSESIDNSIEFEYQSEAKVILQDRFISLSNSISKYGRGGVYITPINSNGDIMGKEEKFL